MAKRAVSTSRSTSVRARSVARSKGGSNSRSAWIVGGGALVAVLVVGVLWFLDREPASPAPTFVPDDDALVFYPGEGIDGDLLTQRATARDEVVTRAFEVVAGPGPGRVAVARVVDGATGAAVGGVEVEFFLRPLARDIWQADTLRRRVPAARAQSAGDGLVYLSTGQRGSFFASAVGPVHLSMAEVLVLALAPNGALNGSATDDGLAEIPVVVGGAIRGVVRDGALRPMPGRLVGGKVVAVPGAATTLGMLQGDALVLRRAPIGADGAFELRGVPAGAGWRVMAYDGEFAPSLSAAVDVAAGATVDIDVVAGRTFAVRGRVVDAQGRPVAGAQVGVLSKSDGSNQGPLSVLAQPRLDTVSAADGRFAFAAPRAAKVKIFAFLEGGPASSIVTLDLRDGARDVVLRLRAISALMGSVVDAAGVPLSGARVTYLGSMDRNRALPANLRVRASTAADGTFALDPPVEGSGGSSTGGAPSRGATGGHRILVEKGGYLGELFELSLPDNNARFALAPSVALQGRVLNARSREPVPSFTVALDVPDRHRGMGRDLRVERRVPVRSADGTFQTPLLERAHTRITIEADGFGPMGRNVVLSPGSRGAEDPLVFMLLPAITINGIVEDAARQPIAGARVTVGGQHFAGIDGILQDVSGEALTDASGRFTLEGVRSEVDLFLHASHPQYLDLTNEPIPWDTGDLEGALFKLQMVQGGRLTGSVFDESRVGRGDQIVVAFARDQSVPIVSVVSAADGSYAFDHLIPDVGLNIAVLDAGDTLTVGTLLGSVQAEKVMVFEGQSQVLNLRAASSAGHLVSGTLMYESGQPVVGGNVYLVPESMGVMGSLGAAAGRREVVDEAGRFSFEGVRTGTYLLAFGAGGPDDNAGRQRLVVQGPESGLALTLSSQVLDVLVVDESGQPVPGAQVRLRPGGEGEPGDPSPDVRSTIADGDGRARFAGVHTGALYQVLARGPQGEERYGEGVSTVTVAGSETRVDAVLPAGSTADVRVVNGLSRDPVAGAVLYVDYVGEPPLPARAITDGAGGARLRNLRNAPAVLVVQAMGYRQGRFELPQLRGDQPLELVLTPGAELVITVRDSAGDPVPGAQLVFSDDAGKALSPRSGAWGGATSGALRTGADGTATTHLLAPGQYLVAADKGDESWSPAPVTVPTTGTVKVELTPR